MNSVHTSSVLQVQLHTADIPSEAYLLPIPKEHKLCSLPKCEENGTWFRLVCRVTGMRNRTPGVVTFEHKKTKMVKVAFCLDQLV